MPSSTFRVTNRRAPRFATGPNIRAMAEHLAQDAENNSPRRTGRLAAGWRVRPGDNGDPATWVVSNEVPYARFVEYGTSRQRAEAPLGRAEAVAKAGVRR